MKKILTAALAFFSLSFLSAQSLSMETVLKGISEWENSRGNFIQEKTLAKNGRILKSSGTYVFCPYGIAWNTLKPVKSTLVLGKDYMVQVSSRGVRTVNDARGNDVFTGMSGSLMAVFSGDDNSLRQNFDIEFNSFDDGSWKVSLTPRDRTIASLIDAIDLWGFCFDSCTEITMIDLKESGGGKVSYRFDGQTHPEELLPDEKELFLER